MSFIQAILLGILQGFTEFIPVSSSGHLLLAHEFFGSSETSLGFDVALHIGTLLALIIYFRKDLADYVCNVFSKNETGRIARLLIYATLPAAITGLLFADYIDNNLRTPVVVAVMLALVGVLMLIVDRNPKKDSSQTTNTQGIKVGFAQILALIPGVSRSGITISAGLLVGMNRITAARFSFLLAIPIVAGSAFGIVLNDATSISSNTDQLAAGVIAAFISGMIAIKFLLGVISRVGLKPFAIYRILLAVMVIVFLV